ncbi:MAG: hypothetical protein KKE94_01275 [Gammaproteobacteria bacterium]|nr:hypothetical protein [Gammaproteobacteria bacterium]
MAQISSLACQHVRCPKVSLSGIALLMLSLAVQLPVQAEATITPEIETSSHAYWLRDQQRGTGLEKGLALLAEPSLTVSYSGAQGAGSAFIKNESVWYDDSQRENKSLTSYLLNSGVTAFDNRLRFNMTAQSAYQVRNSQNNVFSDIITGSENLARTDSYGARLELASRSTSTIRTKLNMSYRKFSSEQPDVDDGIGNFDNKNTQLSAQLAAGRRRSGLFWLLDATHDNTSRELLQDFSSDRINSIAGLPLLSSLSVILRGNYEDNSQTNTETGNSNFSGYYRSFKSVGYGLEYRFGRASHINVTRNHASFSGDSAGIGSGNEDYYAAEVFLAPSRRSSLSYSYDRRFFGSTSTLTGQYNLRTVTARLSLSEAVQVLSNLDLVSEDLGIFVCPDGAEQITDCVRPPSSNYQLLPGQSFQRGIEQSYDVSQELVKRRAAALNVGYSNRRVKLNITISEIEDEYVESERFTQTTLLSAAAGWQISRRTSYQLSASHYDSSYDDIQRADSNILVETGFEHQLNKDAKVKLTFRRTARNSSLQQFNLEENRLSLSYNHRL